MQKNIHRQQLVDDEKFSFYKIRQPIAPAYIVAKYCSCVQCCVDFVAISCEFPNSAISVVSRIFL